MSIHRPVVQWGLCLLLTIPLGLRAAEKADGIWKDPAGNFSCTLPKGWSVKQKKADLVIFQKDGTAKNAFAHINVFSDKKSGLGKAGKSLNAFAQHYIKKFRVKTTSVTPTKLNGINVIYAVGYFKMGSQGQFADVFVFAESKEKLHLAMLSCQAKEQATYEPQFKEFVKTLKYPSP